MSKLSPGFNDRFANIELDQNEKISSTLKTPNKQHGPQSHGNSTPSKGPKLSTALRAESRGNPSRSKPSDLVQTVHKRNLHSSRTKEDSPAASDREKQQKKYPGLPSFSFMKDTSSSRKKQSSVGTSGPPPLRTPANMEVYSRRTRSQTLMKKRQFPKSSLHSPEVSNMELDFSDRPTVFSTAPPSRNSSPHTLLTDRSNEYVKLYNTTSMPAFNFPRERSKKNLVDSHKTKEDEKTSQRLHPSKAPALPHASSQKLPKSASVGQIRSENTLIAKSSSKSDLSIKAAPRIKSHGSHSLDTKSRPKKPCSVNEVLKDIYRADSSFFRQNSSLDDTLEANASIPVPEFLNSQRGKALNMYERGELIRNSRLYYVPEPSKPYEVSPDINISNFKDNYGFDDADGNYAVKPGGHIEYRYEIISSLGTGSFGNVVLCRDHKYERTHQSRYVAIKIIKNNLSWLLQAVTEIKMLKHLSQSPQNHIIAYYDHFNFRGHMCIVTEALSLNLYTFLEIGQFRGLSLKLVRSIMVQILQGMDYIHMQKVIHCDLKPENIMIKLPPNYQENVQYDDLDMEIKLIDFGSSCFEDETSFSYIQSRFYRAPEVILGALYGYPIDVWSIACVCAELFTGNPLLSGKNELEQIALMLEMFGAPSSSYITTERKKLTRHLKGNLHKSLKDPLAADTSSFKQVDEKKLKKTFLYSLFNAEGKINLQFLNLQLQSSDSRDCDSRAPSPFKRNVKLSSRAVEVALRLASSGETKRDQADFSKFITSMFQWNPKERATVPQLLQSRFLSTQKDSSEPSRQGAFREGYRES